MSYKVIYVNPIERVSVQGRDQQIYTVRTDTGELVKSTNMRRTKESDASEEFHFPYNPTTNRLETGLDQIIKNPFKGDVPSDLATRYNLSTSWLKLLEEIVTQDKIAKQTEFEILAGVEPDFYTSKIEYTIFNIPGHVKTLPPPTHLQSFKLILYDRPNRFTSETPRGRLAIQLAQVESQIAKSKTDVNSSYHRYFISQENEAEVESTKKRDIINKATYHLYKLQNEDSELTNYKIATLLTNHARIQLVKGKVSFSKIKDVMNQFISDGGDRYQMENIDKFNDVIELRETPAGLKKFQVKFLIQEALNSNVMAIREGYYVWHSKAGTQNMYKHADYNKLVSLLLNEYENFDPKSKNKEVTNWYGELLQEVKGKDGWVD